MKFHIKPLPFFRFIFLFVLVAGWTTMESAAQEHGLIPEQVAKIKSVSAAEMSGDGRYIAYTVSVPADPLEKNESASTHLYVYDRQSDSTAPFVTDKGVSSVRFRPGHSSLTFLSTNEDDKRVLYEISLNGGESQRLYAFETSLIGYEWAPDGDRIAFMANEPKEEEETELPYEPEFYEENLPQRRGYVHNLSGEDREPGEIATEGSIYQMKWSPDGQRLAVAAAPTPHVDDFYMKQQVHLFNSNGSERLGGIDHEGKLGQMDWSPDGNRLAMIAGADLHDPIDGRLFVVPADGGEPTNIAPDYEGKFEDFEWAGEHTLQFIASRGTGTVYGSIEDDGTDIQNILQGGSDQPVLQSFDRHQDGEATAFVADRPDHPAELYLMEETGAGPERITFHNEWLENVSLGKQEVVTWDAEDGLGLEGVLIYPAGYEDGQRYPLITVVHGGPEAHYSNGWLTSYSSPGQMGAANGFAVFYPNYRGSTGRGVEFAKSSQGDPAGKEFDDIVNGIDHLVDEGLVDEDRVGVTGGSYGGYATAWMSTYYSDRFAAGVMFVGISNNISKWGTSDIPEELYLVHSRKRIWEDYSFFLERSPIYYIDRAETPLLIMHGKEDTRVDPGQSYELFRHLKTRTDVPVRLILYPGEGHGNTRATSRYDYNLRMLQWFEEYLKGGGEGEGNMPDTELIIEKE